MCKVFYVMCLRSPEPDTSLPPTGSLTTMDYLICAINTNGAIKPRDPSRGRVSGQRGPRSKCARAAKTAHAPQTRPTQYYKLRGN